MPAQEPPILPDAPIDSLEAAARAARRLTRWSRLTESEVDSELSRFLTATEQIAASIDLRGFGFDPPQLRNSNVEARTWLTSALGFGNVLRGWRDLPPPEREEFTSLLVAAIAQTQRALGGSRDNGVALLGPITQYEWAETEQILSVLEEAAADHRLTERQVDRILTLSDTLREMRHETDPARGDRRLDLWGATKTVLRVLWGESLPDGVVKWTSVLAILDAMSWIELGAEIRAWTGQG